MFKNERQTIPEPEVCFRRALLQFCGGCERGCIFKPKWSHPGWADRAPPAVFSPSQPFTICKLLHYS